MAKKITRKKAAKKVTRKKAAKKSVGKTSAKKTTRKKVAKKVTRKKAVKRARASSAKRATASVYSGSSARHRVYNLTKEVPEHQYFILANGRPVRHVAELASLLDELEDHVFQHHVTPDRNDFYNWVEHVFEDVDLARKIAGVDDKKRLQLVIYRHLAGHDD